MELTGEYTAEKRDLLLLDCQNQCYAKPPKEKHIISIDELRKIIYGEKKDG